MKETEEYRTIMIADDEPAYLNLLSFLLTQHGFKVHTAVTGKEVIESTKHNKPDLLLLDVLFPDMSGYEVCRILKADTETSSVPVIFISALNKDTEKIRGFEVGAIDFITKPYSNKEIITRINNHLEINYLKSQLELSNLEYQAQNAQLKAEIGERIIANENLSKTLSDLEKSRIASLNLMDDLREEIEKRKQKEKELFKSEWQYRSLFASMQEGFALHEIICDRKGIPVDYRFLEINPAFEKLTGLKSEDIIGKRVLSLMPETEKFFITKYGKVALEMEPVEFEHFSKGLNRYYRVFAFSPEKGKFATLFEDVTEKRILEKSLSENEVKFRTIFESVGSGFIYMSKRGKIIDTNPAFCELTGYSKEKLIGKNVISLANEVLRSFGATDLLKVVGSAISGKSVRAYPFSFNNKYLSGSSFLSKDKKIVIGVITDHTPQMKAEQARLDLLSRNKAILGAVPDIIMEVNYEKIYTWANSAGYDFFGKKVIGKSADLFYIGEQKTFDIVNPVFNGEEETIYIESWQRRRDGQKRLLAWSCRGLKDQSGKVIGAISSARDITELKEKEVELEDSKKLLGELNLYLQKIREEERRLIARELHDELGQALTAVKIDLGTLKMNVNDRDLVKTRIEKITSLVTESITTVKRLTSELRPHVLDDLGLITAIEWYTSEFSARTGIKITLKIDKNTKVEKEHELVIFRILQESLTNIARHSKAEITEIRFYKKDGNIILEITDNGIGLTGSDQKSTKSFGLLNMKERAKDIGGNLIIVSEPGLGTRIRLSILESIEK